MERKIINRLGLSELTIGNNVLRSRITIVGRPMIARILPFT